MSETRTIRTVLELNASRFNAGAASAAAYAKSLSGELARISDSSGKFRADYDRVGNTLLGFGTAAAAGLGLATKASMDWESAWAGVRKTVDGSDAELATLEEGLRGLTKVLPASHQEIAAVAEAAGQLGVARDDIVGFTETMINLGETTNLTSEEAATSLAQLMNIMGTSGDDVDNLGSALVALGNDGASTEKDILSMGMRVSAVGKQMGLTEGEVLGLASAMSSVGIEAEAGGTAISMVMKKIDASVREGGDSLQGWADMAGMTASEFARAWNDDAAGALNAVTTGLGAAGAAGEDMNGMLADLGIKGIREADTMLRLAQSGDLLADSLETGNTAFAESSALAAEAAERYKTVESQVKLAKNALVEAGIDIGASVLPVLADAAGGVADLAGWFSALPGPVQSAVTGLGAAAGASALLAGGLMKAVPAAMETVSAFKRIRTEAPGVSSAIGKVGTAVGITATALTGLSMLSAYGDSLTDFAIGANEAADMALRTADAVDPLQTVFAGMGEETYLASASTEEMANNLDVLANGSFWGSISDGAAGIANAFGANASTLEDSRQRLEEYGQGLAGLAQTDLPAATEAFSRLWQDGFGGGDQAGIDLLDTMPALREELIGLASAAELPTDDLTLLKIASGELVPELQNAEGASGEFGDAVGDATGEVEEQVDALKELQDLLEGTANLLLGVRGSERDFLDSVDASTEALKEHGKVFQENGDLIDRFSEDGRAAEAALDGIASATHGWADAAEEAGATGAELDAIMQEGRTAFIDMAEDMGMSEEAANALADELQLIPEFVETEVKVETEQAKKDVADLNGIMTEGTEVEVPVTADTAPAEEEVTIWGSQVGDVPATVYVESDLYGAESTLEAFYAEMQDQDWTVDINGETVDAEQALSILLDEVNAGEGTVMINGTPVNAESSLLQLIDIINASDGTVTIDGNNVPANLKTDQAKAKADGTTGTMDVDGNNSGANAATDSAKRKADGTTGTIDVNARTAGANAAIAAAAATRTAYINVVARNVGANLGSFAAQIGRADGGWLNSGLNSGGWVPGAYPGKGVDNVLWPVMQGAAGGRQLGMQPLAGTEYVVNGQSAQQWGPALEAINSGITPAQMAAMVGTGSSRSIEINARGLNAYEVARESRTVMRHEIATEAVPLP